MGAELPGEGWLMTERLVVVGNGLESAQKKSH